MFSWRYFYIEEWLNIFTINGDALLLLTLHEVNNVRSWERSTLPVWSIGTVYWLSYLLSILSLNVYFYYENVFFPLLVASLSLLHFLFLDVSIQLYTWLFFENMFRYSLCCISIVLAEGSDSNEQLVLISHRHISRRGCVVSQMPTTFAIIACRKYTSSVKWIYLLVHNIYK
jgi:hypothetical protein